MIYVALKLDDEKILADGEVDIADAYRVIDNAYASKEIYKYKKSNGVRYYTRQKDSNDYQYIWMVILALDKVDWFKKYICQWEYIETDNEGNIEYKEDLIPQVQVN